MNEISLPENSCPLCDLDGVKSTPYSIDRGRYYLCPNCGPFSISEIAYMLIRGTNNEDIKAKISFHIKHNSNNQKPIFLTRDYFRDVIETIIMPSVSEQLNNLLSWLGEKSNSSLETVQGNVEHLVAYVGCKNSKQVIQLLDQLWEDNLIIMELPTTGPLRERAYFKKFATHLTRLGIEKIEQNKKSDIFTFNIPTLTVENFLLGGEGNDREIKGSFRLDLNHLLKGGGKNETKEFVEKNFNYNLDLDLEDLRKNYRFNESCQDTVPQAIFTSLISESFEDSIRKAIYIGGDSDTLACINGSIAEAFYGGVPNEIKAEVYKRLDDKLLVIVNKFTDKYVKKL